MSGLVRPTIRQIVARVHRRLIVLALVLSGATLMLSGLLTMRGYFQRNLELVASTISYAVEPAVVFGDREAIDDSLRSAGLTDIRLVEVRDPAGATIARWPRSADAASARGGLAERLLGVAPVVRPVRQAGRVIAEVRVHGSTATLFGYLASGAVISLCCLGISAMALRLLARRLQRDVVGPLDQIAAVAHAVRQDRAFDRRVPPCEVAEIERFRRDFNALLGELEGWHLTMTAEQVRLAHEASHDPLTRLGNRALFERQLGELAAEAAATGQVFALIYIDANGFKQINDVHGHAAGDALLVAIAKRLRACLRLKDFAFRLGGDEFAVLVRPEIDAGGMERIVARITGCMADPVVLPSGTKTVVSLSMGSAIFPENGTAVDALVACADARMYENKQSHRDLQSRLDAR